MPEIENPTKTCMKCGTKCAPLVLVCTNCSEVLPDGELPYRNYHELPSYAPARSDETVVPRKSPISTVTAKIPAAGRDLIILAFLVVAAVALAWPTLHMGVWLDECLSINSSTAPDVVAVVKNAFGRQDDYHPPLAYIFLNVWMKMFGTGDVAVKVPFLLCGIATIPSLYWLGKTAHSARVGLLAAFFFVVAPLANFLSCQCRGYALATLLSTLCVTFFIHLQRDKPSAEGAMPNRIAFAGVTLLAAALCYTEIIGCVLIPCLGIATLLICARQYFRSTDSANRKQAVNKLLRCCGALLLAFVLFVPWIPSILNQVHGALYVDRLPLSRFAEQFYWNVMNVLPTHIGLGLYLLLAVAAVFGGKIFLNSGKNKQAKTASISPAAFGNTDVLIVLLCTTLIPCTIMGYITNWFAGYFRYIYPYAPGAWVLLAIAVVVAFSNTDGAIKGVSRIGLATFLVMLSAVDISWNLYHAKDPNSGLSTVAKEAIAGKFDNTALIIAPDAIGPTLGYYLPENVRKEHSIGLFGYAKWDDVTVPANIPEMTLPWTPDSIVAETEKRISELHAKGFKFFALARDSDKQLELLSTEKMPRKKRVYELLDVLNKKYKLISTTHYPAVTEDVTVTVYELAP